MFVCSRYYTVFVFILRMCLGSLNLITYKRQAKTLYITLKSL